MSGWGVGVAPSHQTHTRLVVSCVTRFAVENNTAQVPVVDVTVPGGTLGSAGALNVAVISDYLNDTTAINCYTLRLYYGTSPQQQMAALTTGNISQACERSWSFVTTDLFATNGTSCQASFTQLRFAAGSAPGTSLVGTRVMSGNTSLTIDSTADQLLRMTVQLSSVTGCVSYRFLGLHVERVAGG